jgi:hypothetical protein
MWRIGFTDDRLKELGDEYTRLKDDLLARQGRSDCLERALDLTEYEPRATKKFLRRMRRLMAHHFRPHEPGEIEKAREAMKFLRQSSQPPELLTSPALLAQEGEER